MARYLPLGQLVKFDYSFQKRSTHYHGTTWKRTPVASTSPHTGIVVGVRTVADTRVYNNRGPEDDWDDWVTQIGKTHAVYLVAYNIRRNPIHVLVKDVEAIL